MNIERVFAYLYEMSELNLSENTTFTIFVGSMITLSSTLTYLLCFNRPKIEYGDIHSMGLEHRVSIISNEMVSLKSYIEEHDNKIDYIGELVDDVNERVEKIEECLTDSD